MMIIKIALLLCAVATLAQGQGYAVLVSFISGTGCSTPSTQIDSKYYLANQCAYYYRNTYDASNPNVIQIGQYADKDCSGSGSSYQKNLRECTNGTSTDYYWDYVSDLSATETAGLVTYTVYSANVNTTCYSTPLYVAQSQPTCFSNNGQPTINRCTATGATNRTTCTNSADQCAGPSCTINIDSNIDKCQKDTDGYYYANSCGASKAGVTTTTTTPTPGKATTTASPKTSSSNGSGSGSNGSGGSDAGATTEGSSSSSSGASILSACLFMIVAPLAISLL